MHTLWIWQNWWSYVDNQLPWTTSTYYSNNLQDYSHVNRNFWFDNGTPAPKFDHSELMIHTDKSWLWNVSNMLWKSPFANWHNLNEITWSDFTTGNISAVITPKVWWPSFILPIDANWNIQIPASMQESFNNRYFAFLEVWKVQIDWNTINLNPIATVKWDWTMVFDKITELIPWKVTQEFVSWTDNWYWVPFGWNRYHHINKTETKEPVWQFVELSKDSQEQSWPSDELQSPTNPQEWWLTEEPVWTEIAKFPVWVDNDQEPVWAEIMKISDWWVDSTQEPATLWDNQELEWSPENVPENDKSSSVNYSQNNWEFKDPEFIDLEPRPNNYNEVNNNLRWLNIWDKVIFGTKDLWHHLELTVLDDWKYNIKRFEFGNEVSNYDTENLPLLESERSWLIFSKVNYPGGEYGNIKELIIYRKKEIENTSGDLDDNIWEDLWEIDSNEKYVNGRNISIWDLNWEYNALIWDLRHAWLIDESENWVWGDTKLVLHWDIIWDRGTSSLSALLKIADLKEQAVVKWWDIKYLLGNHDSFAFEFLWEYQVDWHSSSANLNPKYWDPVYQQQANWLLEFQYYFWEFPDWTKNTTFDLVENWWVLLERMRKNENWIKILKVMCDYDLYSFKDWVLFTHTPINESVANDMVIEWVESYMNRVNKVFKDSSKRILLWEENWLTIEQAKENLKNIWELISNTGNRIGEINPSASIFTKLKESWVRKIVHWHEWFSSNHWPIKTVSVDTWYGKYWDLDTNPPAVMEHIDIRPNILN